MMSFKPLTFGIIKVVKISDGSVANSLQISTCWVGI